MLTEQQKKFAKDLAVLVGQAIAEIPAEQSADGQEIVALIKDEIDLAASQPKPEIKQVVESGLDVLVDVAALTGNQKFISIATIVDETADTILEDDLAHPIIDLFKAGIALKKVSKAA